MVNQGFIGPQVRDFHSQTLNRYQVSIMTRQVEIQRLPNTVHGACTGLCIGVWRRGLGMRACGAGGLAAARGREP
ncbi:hypothetical protein ES332_A12G106900v1 [Gossypium tomentosum]|uniref:Uncharacterized protein n=1 Tax=Gossypium tomentosum TaxID=34277 RepID=A0A5D2MV75_GOSTO|nr:hypothetical protein ES332_A12G106900v1 [Gossypium tomentosum]